MFIFKDKYIQLLCNIDNIDTESLVQEVRLVGGHSASSGRVEIFLYGEWGTVCNDGWNLVDAHVVCRQLGYLTAIATYKNAFFGEGSRFVWLTNVQCNGSELFLGDCKHEIFADPDCSHAQDVGVLCSGKYDFFFA